MHVETKQLGKYLSQPDIPILGQEINVEVQGAMDGPFKVQQTRSKIRDNEGHAGRSPQLALG